MTQLKPDYNNFRAVNGEVEEAGELVETHVKKNAIVKVYVDGTGLTTLSVISMKGEQNEYNVSL